MVKSNWKRVRLAHRIETDNIKYWEAFFEQCEYKLDKLLENNQYLLQREIIFKAVEGLDEDYFIKKEKRIFENLVSVQNRQASITLRGTAVVGEVESYQVSSTDESELPKNYFAKPISEEE